MQGKSLLVEAEGVRFLVGATPIAVKGKWGVRVLVEATSADGKVHAISNVTDLLSFGGTIDALDGGEAGGGFGEGGSHGEKVEIPPGKPVKFSRDYPGKNDWDPIAPGQVLRLDVGLWSLSSPEEKKTWPAWSLVTVELSVPRKGGAQVKLIHGQTSVTR